MQVSTWNPYWAENQKTLLTLIEDEQADVVDQVRSCHDRAYSVQNRHTRCVYVSVQRQAPGHGAPLANLES